jgi:hypothetical protein
MKLSLLPIALLLSALSAQAQLIARVELKQPIAGICDNNNIYALFGGFKGQVPPVPPLTREELLARLNSELSFLKANPKFKGKFSINFFINCKGEVVQCEIGISSKEPELDAQVLKIFKELTQWKAGKLDGKEVDASEIFSYKIKKGQVLKP